MLTATYLFAWTIVGFAGTQYSTHERYDWRPLGEFSKPEACEFAAKQLVLKNYRCVAKNGGV